MARVPVLINGRAGTAASESDVRAKVAKAFAGAGVQAEVELVEHDKTEERCRAIAERGDPLLVVGGGDGTVATAASVLAGTKTALGVLPLGTLNHFARDLGMPLKLEEAVEAIAGGHERSVDVGEMNGRVFINNSAIGLYPLMVLDRDLQRKRLGRSKRLALIVASLRTLVRFNHRRLLLTINEERQARVDTPLLFVGNNDYRLDIAAPGERERLDGGELSVMVMRKKTRRGLIAASVRALLNRSRADDMVRLDGVERLRVSSRSARLVVSLDGEVVSEALPLDYRIRKRALRVMAP